MDTTGGVNTTSAHVRDVDGRNKRKEVGSFLMNAITRGQLTAKRVAIALPPDEGRVRVKPFSKKRTGLKSPESGPLVSFPKDRARNRSPVDRAQSPFPTINIVVIIIKYELILIKHINSS